MADLLSNHGIQMNRADYDAADVSHVKYAASAGLSEEVVREISRQKDEPAWMLDKRLRGLELFTKTPLPAWGPPLAGLDLDKIVYFVRPDAKESKSWEEVPDEIRATF